MGERQRLRCAVAALAGGLAWGDLRKKRRARSSLFARLQGLEWFVAYGGAAALIGMAREAVSDDGADEDDTVERISQFIKDQGGEVTKVDPWGMRKLAYPINRHMEAFYAVTEFKLEPTAVSALEEEVGRAEEILRHIVARQIEVREEAPEERGEGGAGLLPIVGIGRQIIGLLGSALFTNRGHAFKKGVS